MSEILNVMNLKTYFHMHDHIVKAVDGVDFVLNRGETLGIVGESGCGKSAMALSIMKLIPCPPGRIESGNIMFEGRNLLKLQKRELQKIRGNKISMIFQEPMTSLNPLYTIGYQISEPLIVHGNYNKKQALEKCVELLGHVGIPDPHERIHEYPHQLSGGLRQRVMIAMALACNPFILIADEPTTALDVTIQSQILRLMKKIKKETNSSVIFITHDLAVIAGFADRVMVMYAGIAMEMADVGTLFHHPHHPYTKGLLGSIPKPGQHKRTAQGTPDFLSIIKGSVPDPRAYPAGCRFAPRCPEVMNKCMKKEPGVFTLKNNHEVRCYLYG